MKRFIMCLAVCLGLILAAPASAEVITGTIVDNTPACVALGFDTYTKTLLNRWIELRTKLDAGLPLTDPETTEGATLEYTDTCGLLKGGIPVTLLLLDGGDYWVQFSDGYKVILKSEGFVRDE